MRMLLQMAASFLFLGLLPLQAAAKPCATALDCSLNGVCASGACRCDAPWAGEQCETMAFAATTPAAGKNLYNSSDPRNTWNGPIVTGPDGVYHIYVPIYKVGSLGGPSARGRALLGRCSSARSLFIH